MRLAQWWILLAVAFVLLMIFVKPVVIGGDASSYADDVEKSLSQGWGTPELWNFAHVIWRPMGRLLAEWFLPILTPYCGGNTNLAIGVLLMLPNLIAALICGLALETMVWKLTGSGGASFLTAFAFLCLSPLLHYSRLGSPYICGIACTTLATYFACFHSVRSWRTAVVTGLFSGAAVLCWAPFLVSFPAIVLSIWILGRDGNEGMPRLRFAILVCAVAGGLTLLFYMFAMGVAGIHGVDGLRTWIHQSSVDSKDAKALRMVSGMARGFYELGDDSVWVKWFVFHDPYAKVGIRDLIRESLSRLALFYTALAGLVVLLWHTARGKRVLLFVAVAAVPHLVVALSYESGSPERYVGMLPALFLGFGYVVGSPELSRGRRIAAAVLCCLHIPFNMASASERNLSNVLERDPARLEVLFSVPAQSHLVVINVFDPLLRLSFGDPLNPLHKRRFATVKTIGAFGRPAQVWRSDFACDALSTADRGGEVWVSKRFLSAEPHRSWLWVERDIPGVSWEALHGYFSSFDAGIEKGGADGFFQVPMSGESRGRLERELASSGEPCEGRR
jgi:hypothetical protein